MHKLEMSSSIFEANDWIARDNREPFRRLNIFAVNVMSAPGAGKTSTLEETIKRLADRYRLAVIEGDLQTTIDSDRIKALGIPSYQITTGQICHLDARMIHNALCGIDL